MATRLEPTTLTAKFFKYSNGNEKEVLRPISPTLYKNHRAGGTRPLDVKAVVLFCQHFSFLDQFLMLKLVMIPEI